MQVLLADTMGFCAGVKRAFVLAQTKSDRGNCVCYGPLVHNQTVVDFLAEKGVATIESLTQIPSNCTGIIIRSHGCTLQEIEKIKSLGLDIIDATCPRVKKIHDLVLRLPAEGYQTIIFGNKDHPEVQAILSRAGQAIVINSLDQIENLKYSNKIAIVSQTTKDSNQFLQVVVNLLPQVEELRAFNTICPATYLRLKAVREIAGKVDLLLVIGDRKSSNTSTLTDACGNMGVMAFQVENAAQIKPEWFAEVKRVGITAGASTPDWIIKEVVDKMTFFTEDEHQELELTTDGNPDNGAEIPENEEYTPGNDEAVETAADISSEEDAASNNEESFAQMEAEMADFTTLARGSIITGKVIQVQDDEVMVDVGGKSEGIVPLRELSAKELASAKEMVEVGDEIEVMVLKWDDDGSILLSKRRVDSQRALDRLEEIFNNSEVVEGVVTGSVKGGLLVDIGVTAFLPASHIEDGYVKNMEEYIDQTFKFKIIEFNRNKRRGSQIVVSRREMIIQEKSQMKEMFWQNVAEGQIRTGTVKRIVDYGAFVDLGGYDGLLHVSEMDYKRIENPYEVLEEGQEVEVYILGLDQKKERVSLSLKKLMKSPWNLLVENCREGDVLEGRVVRIAPFGAFVELQPGVDGLVHISQLADRRVGKPEEVVAVNDVIKVKVLSIDLEAKKVGLSLKEAQQDAEQETIEEYLQNQDQTEPEGSDLSEVDQMIQETPDDQESVVEESQENQDTESEE